MLTTRFFPWVLVSSLLATPSPSQASNIIETFSTDPLARGWQVSGDAGLFQWNPARQVLEVTWDSSKPNSYFAFPLGLTLTTDDNFSFGFDISLSQATAGNNPQKPNPFQLALGFINLAEATATNFIRGSGSDSPDLVEFSFFPDPGGAWQWGPSLTSVLIDASGTNWSAGGFSPQALNTNDVFRITLNYSAKDHALRTTILRNGEPFIDMPAATFGPGFLGFKVDHVAVCSYSEAGQDPAYAGSILAAGEIDNISVTLPGASVAVSAASVQISFPTRSNWVYSVERSQDFRTWKAVGTTIDGKGDPITLTDTNAPGDWAAYRVNGEKQ